MRFAPLKKAIMYGVDARFNSPPDHMSSDVRTPQVSTHRLIAFRDAVKQAEPVHAEPVKPGIIVNVKV